MKTLNTIYSKEMQLELQKLGYVGYDCDIFDFKLNAIEFGKENVLKYIEKLENDGILISKLENDSWDVFGEYQHRENSYNGNFLGHNFEYAFDGNLYDGEHGVGITTFHLHGDIRGNYSDTYLISKENIKNLFNVNCTIKLYKNDIDFDTFDSTQCYDTWYFENIDGNDISKKLQDILEELSC